MTKPGDSGEMVKVVGEYEYCDLDPSTPRRDRARATDGLDDLLEYVGLGDALDALIKLRVGSVEAYGNMIKKSDRSRELVCWYRGNSRCVEPHVETQVAAGFEYGVKVGIMQWLTATGNLQHA
ncbi:MAG: hypothetical protein U1E73_09620 [Planctomycetota bacterium]